MSWLIQEPVPQPELAHRFRELMHAPEILKLPGAHDALTARIAQQVGFPALYLSGAAFTASRALPDLGIINSTEVATHAREITRATNLPLLVDIDTGFGGTLNAARTAREMFEAGVAAVQIEDQELPKKCGHLNDKKLVAPEEMAQKIHTLKRVAPTLLIIARTDAKATEGIESAIERAQLYMAAGADGIFPEALQSEDEFQQFRDGIEAPLLANMTEFGQTPYYTAEQFQNWGYQIMLFPVSSLRVAARACRDLFEQIHQTGTQVDALEQMLTRRELYETIDYFDYEKMDSNIAQTVLPTETPPEKQ